MFKEKFKKKITNGLISLLTSKNKNSTNVIMFTNIMTALKDNKGWQQALDSKPSSIKELEENFRKTAQEALKPVVITNKELLSDALKNNSAFILNIGGIFNDLTIAFNRKIIIVNDNLKSKNTFNQEVINANILLPHNQSASKAMEVFLNFNPIVDTIKQLFQANDNTTNNNLVDEEKFKSAIDKMADKDMINLSGLLQRQNLSFSIIYEVYTKLFDHGDLANHYNKMPDINSNYGKSIFD